MTTKLPSDLPLVEADSSRLHSMLHSLIDNAMAAIRRANRPGQVTIVTAAEPNGEFPKVTSHRSK